MVNELVAEQEDKRQGLLNSISPYDKYKATLGSCINYNKTKKCPKCQEDIPEHFYWHKCGWKQDDHI